MHHMMVCGVGCFLVMQLFGACFGVANAISITRAIHASMFETAAVHVEAVALVFYSTPQITTSQTKFCNSRATSRVSWQQLHFHFRSRNMLLR